MIESAGRLLRGEREREREGERGGKVIGGCGSKGMGTKVHVENYFAGHCPMRDPSRESNGASWASCYGDNNLPNGQFYYGYLPRTVADSHSGYDKDVVKQTMLEHEAIFKSQVYELHRLYRVQRDLMDEVRRKEQFEQRIPYETSSSSSPVPSQMKSEDVQRWHHSSLPLATSVCGRPMCGPETVHSSPCSAKGKSIQAGLAPFENGYSPKNSEVSESRPTKVRRMLDLQLPADEYIDDTYEVEQFGDAKVSDNVSLLPDNNGKVAIENGKLCLNYAVKTEHRGDASKLDSHVSKSKALADLNEPVDVEETTAVSSVDILSYAGCHNDVKHGDLPAKSLISSKDVTQSSMRGSLNGISKDYHLGNRPSNQDLFCYALESEQQKGSLTFINHGIHPVKGPTPFHPANSLLVSAGQPLAFSTGDHFKGDPSKSKSGGIDEISDRSYPVSNYYIPEPTMASHLPTQPSFFHPTDLDKSWDQFASSWGKPTNGLSQKPTSVQTGAIFTSANGSKGPQSSAQSNGLFSNKWNLNCSPGANAAIEGEPYVKNAFNPGSAATSFKELSTQMPPVGFDSGKNSFKATTSIDVKPVKDVNLNVALLSDALHNHKSEDPMAALPWLRGKSACSTKVETSSNGPKSLPDPVLQGPSRASSSNEENSNANMKPESSDIPSSRKILGVPIFENIPTPKKETYAIISPPATDDQSARRKIIFDMNLPCELSNSELDNMGVEEEAGVVEKKMQTESASLRNLFDLNSCITEEEIPCITPLPDNSIRRKRDTGIDLEAPVVLEDDETDLPGEDSLIKEPEKLPGLPPCRATDDGEAELAKSAAEAIIAISSSANPIQSEEEVIHIPEEADVEDPLHWLADIACSSRKDSSGEGDRDCLPKELDDFESMTLRLKECTSEEYFPKLSIPEFPNLEESSTRVLTPRTRKGQARRGRQRRDFQRDILPGLASLSRHEVTEDMQTFGGLMRATGYTWQCGTNRRNATRNGCGRGRRRAVAAAPPPVHTVTAPMKQHQQIQINSNHTEVGLEDRSLTGWGKTTRRPRRQRLAAGNLTPPVPLS